MQELESSHNALRAVSALRSSRVLSPSVSGQFRSSGALATFGSLNPSFGAEWHMAILAELCLV